MSEFPKTFACKCGSGKTVSHEAMKAVHPSFDGFTSLEQTNTALAAPGLTIVVMRGLRAHYDICWDCGQRYCTKLEIVEFKMPQQPNALQNRFGKS